MGNEASVWDEGEARVPGLLFHSPPGKHWGSSLATCASAPFLQDNDRNYSRTEWVTDFKG